MRDFPKRLATAEDIRNCKSLVDDGSICSKRPVGSHRRS